jgi:hypothetical protein
VLAKEGRFYLQPERRLNGNVIISLLSRVNYAGVADFVNRNDRPEDAIYNSPVRKVKI